MTALDDERGYRVPSEPRLGGAIRAALTDFYFNSWRLVPANLVWGAVLLLAVFLLYVWPFGAILVLVLLALPTAGLFRLATLIVRDEPVSFRDALAAWRRFLGPALLAGGSLAAITLALGTNVVLGMASGEPLGWALATASGWGLIATWAVGIPLWPLLLDPVRDGVPIAQRIRLAAALAFIRPLRFAFLLVVVAVLVVASAVLFAALITISIAFIALLAARYTLPAADRLEGRATEPVPS